MEIDSEVVTSNYDAFGDFIEWFKEQKDWDTVWPYQWSSAMKQRGFKLEQDGSDWVIQGVKLKGDQ